MRLIEGRSKPLLYLITDRRSQPHASNSAETDSLIDFINRAAQAGVDMIQIRERDLSARQLFHLADKAAEIARLHGARVLINDRADIAATVGAGVHLTTRSMASGVVRRAFGAKMLIGASTHSLGEAKAAEQGGADFIVYGPVFETDSKRVYGSPVGVGALEMVVSRLQIPVLALGGISLENFRQVIDAGAAGVAAISLFVKTDDISSVVETIKLYGKQ